MLYLSAARIVGHPLLPLPASITVRRFIACLWVARAPGVASSGDPVLFHAAPDMGACLRVESLKRKNPQGVNRAGFVLAFCGRSSARLYLTESEKTCQ